VQFLCQKPEIFDQNFALFPGEKRAFPVSFGVANLTADKYGKNCQNGGRPVRHIYKEKKKFFVFACLPDY
jgi:hypothetical protein